MEMEFTLSRLAEISRAPKRAVQLWADAGVIKADASTMLQGSGVHRRFKREEAIISCIVAPFAKQKIAIGGLQSIGHAVRGYLRAPVGKNPELNLLERAIAGKGHNYMLAYWIERRDGDLDVHVFKLVGDTANSPINFFEMMNPGDMEFIAGKRPIKVDVVALNEVLRNMPPTP